ncbi:DEAD/DEAH box helicase [Flavobacterium caeni]|uniref:ATP-dependent DNA helicase RecQ n=1 Tax=Flavobacterium caeni TaxID=490189 RepID=A0A1G5KEY1_9FLAO|nr:DEAD/DEAH box helicase [Flavobacterium caeni]SCY98964.1 ATP-dependent DNA helicase RecQ [Flavobacterium caeni]
MKKQLQAGFVLDCIKETLETTYKTSEIQGLLKQLSYFEIEVNKSNQQFDNSEFEQTFFVANNIISRGLPTRPTLWLENQILDYFKNIVEQDKKLLEIGSIRQELKVDEIFTQLLFKALHIIDPEIKGEKISKYQMPSWKILGSDFEEGFLFEQLPKHVSQMWTQLFEPQRELENVLRFSTNTEDEIDKYLNGSIQIFNEQHLDFSLEFPYETNSQRGLIVEIDGSQHEEANQRFIDGNRDTATEKAKWGKAIRIKTTEWNNIQNKLSVLKNLEKEQLFTILKQNFESPLYFDKNGLNALELCLIPFAVARIQKTILHLIFEGVLDIHSNEWNIAILERDIPCGNLAIQDFEEHLKTLFQLQGISYKLPKINVFVESNRKFALANFYTSTVIDKSKKYDLFIDISVLQRNGLTKIEESINAETKVLVRSSHSPKTKRVFKTSEIITYKKLGKRNKKENKFEENKEQVEQLEIIVQNIFRKTGFRPGQVEIINRAIQGKSVIGLLPTGSGKSLTYQLTSLLQPGMVIVIDPIKSLMKDQYEGLLKNYIDGAIYINSSLNAKQREIALNKIKNAETIFAFVSPERLQDDRFRNDLLETSNLNKNYFSYCIIDEAHCVSEWGHDFRTSYLRLGDNARNYCKTKSDKTIPFFALTATASYDVLSDIQRELDIPDESAIVRLEKLDRPEIQFKIVEVVADFEDKEDLNWATQTILGQAKQRALKTTLQSIPKYYETFSNDTAIIEEAKKVFNGKDIRLSNFQTNTFFEQKGKESNAGLVFCPHRKSYFGVQDNADKLSEHFSRIGTFVGGDDANNEITQSKFVNNELDLLVATKAFGMGIDKSNIRYVVHFNYPSSIESYYQEAGRGGRDRKLALGVLLFNRQGLNSSEKIETVDEDGNIETHFEETNLSIDKKLLHSFHSNNFKGIGKEKRLLAELLTEIKFPSHRLSNDIADRVFEEFGIEISLNAITNANDRQVLYINQNYGSIYLDRETLPFFPNSENKFKATEIANFIRQIIFQEKPTDITAFNWLSTYVPSHKEIGIEKLLSDPNSKNEFQVIIPFVNNEIESIAEYLSSSGLPFTAKSVEKAQNFCSSGEKFIENLSKELGSPIPDDFHAELKKRFLQIRNEEDTYKTIYRLSVIGIIDDYTVNYHAKTITAYISKKPIGHYTQQLEKFLRMYNSEKKTKELIERVPFFFTNAKNPISREIYQCLGFLIKFVYEHVADLRKKSIDAMESACIVGLDDQQGSKGFKEFIDLYMNSKYARPQFLPEDTKDGEISSLEIINDYIDRITTDAGGEINNLKHLRGATTRLITQSIKYSENYALHILKAFSILALEVQYETEVFIQEAKENFTFGFLKMVEDENLITDEASVVFNNFVKRFDDFDIKISEEIQDLKGYLFLKINTNWTKNFTNKFAENYA